MTVRYSPLFIDKLKKQNVRIKNSFREAIALFQKDPYHSSLHNHPLSREHKGYRSINVTSGDYRAIYREMVEPNAEIYAYFVDIGTHNELYE